METALDRIPDGSRCAVVRIRSLGDCVLTTPALSILKASRPDLKIGVVVEDRFAAVFQGNPDVERILPVTIRALPAWAPYFCLNLHGGTRSLGLTLLSGAKLTAGFDFFQGAFAYTFRIPQAQRILGLERKVHTAEHLASAMFYLGCPIGEIPRARLYAAAPLRKKPYAVIHPMASAPEKTWTSSGFLAIADYFRRSCRLETVFLIGPGENPDPFQDYEVIAAAPLEEVKSVLRGAALFVGCDSGPAHMAAAFGIPLVVLFGTSDPVVWAPWRAEAETIVAGKELASLSVERVVEAIEKLRVRV